MEFVSAKPAQSPACCWGNSTSPCRQLSFACFAACFLVLAQTYLANSASLWGRACIPTCSYTTYSWHESWILKSTSVQHSHALAQTLSIKFSGTCAHTCFRIHWKNSWSEVGNSGTFRKLWTCSWKLRYLEANVSIQPVHAWEAVLRRAYTTNRHLLTDPKKNRWASEPTNLL